MEKPESDPSRAQGRIRTAREFETEYGKVVYCPGCRRFAVDFAGFRLLFHRSGYDGFLTCLREAEKDIGPGGPQEVFIGPRDTDESIRLRPGQASEMSLLMEMAAMVLDVEQP